MTAPRPVYRITVRPEPGVWAVPALKHLLKLALRQCGLRALEVAEVPAETGDGS